MSDFAKPVLAIDSALGGCIVAVQNPENGKAFAQSLATQRDQAAKLVPMIQSVMEEGGVTFEDLGLIVTTIGPGSFTGLRISLSTARAMATSLSLPLQGMTTLEIMARTAVPDSRPCTVLLETKRADFYVQSFDESFAPVGEPFCADSAALLPLIPPGNILCGDATARFIDETGANFAAIRPHALLDPVILAKAGLARFLENNHTAPKAEPFYMRGADITLSTKIQRKIRDIPSNGS